MNENNHPVNELMSTTMEKIRSVVDANTIIGQPIQTQDGVTLIPVSKLSFGFATGGGDYAGKNQKPEGKNSFSGGSGAGVKLEPVAFLVVKDGYVRLLSVTPPPASTVDRVIDSAPELFDKVTGYIDQKKAEKAVQENKEIVE